MSKTYIRTLPERRVYTQRVAFCKSLNSLKLWYKLPSLEYGTCHLSVIPVRAEPDDRSEITTQLLFGENLKVLKKQNQWRQIECLYDGYQGWIDEKQFVSIDKKALDKLNDKPTSLALELAYTANCNLHHQPILLGSTLPNFDGMTFKLGKLKCVYNGLAYQVGSGNGNVLEKVCMRYLNAPYLWGGRSPFGIDCSGFTQMVFKFMGVPLKRDAYQQALSGKAINMVNEAKLGDMAFFENKDGRIHHVGIILNEGKIIHAAGRVRLDRLDTHGIYNEETKKYTHRLKVIKRVL